MRGGAAEEDRIALVVDLLTRLATGDLAARAETSGADDEIDAVLVGINMLAEELDEATASSSSGCLTAPRSWSA